MSTVVIGIGDLNVVRVPDRIATLGLGSCYIASFRPAFNQDADRSLHRRFGIPDGYRATLALAVGYADGEPSPRAERLSGTVNYVE